MYIVNYLAQGHYFIFEKYVFFYLIWRPPSLSELTPMIINMGLTHLGSKSSILISNIKELIDYKWNYPKFDKKT